MWNRTARTAMVIAVVMCLPLTALGFGKNKLQYQRLQWQSLESDFFTIYTHEDSGNLGTVCYRLCALVYAQLGRSFRFHHRTAVPVIVYGSPNLFEQTNVLPAIIPEGVGGFTELFKNRIVVPWTGSYGDLRHVLHHELVHAFQFGILYDRIGGSFIRNTGLQLPLWFAEGLAEYLSSGWDTEADMFLMDRVVHSEVGSPGPELSGYMAYKGGQAFLLFLASAYGDSLFERFLQVFQELRTVEAALERTYRVPLNGLAEQWKQEMRRLYWPEIAVRQDPRDMAVCLSKKRFAKAQFNLRPRISPDGLHIAFFSDRRDDTRIYVVNRRGEIVTHISQQSYGGYFESFHPFRSGMCWSPNGRRLAFVTKAGGVDQIRIVDLEFRTLIGRYEFAGLRSISSPDWSPDGSRLVFTALRNDCSDLYLYSFRDSSLTRLTMDPTFESAPAFSPDGELVVFAIEDTAGVFRPETHGRGQTDLACLRLSDRSVRRLTATPWNEREPRFTGRDTIVFVSDRNGIANVYMGPLDSLECAWPLTDFIGGCSSPDWSRDSATLVFTLFQKGTWHVYLANRADTLQQRRALAPTRWAQHLLDSARPFISRRPLRDTIEVPPAERRHGSRSPGSSDKVTAGEPSGTHAMTNDGAGSDSARAARTTVDSSRADTSLAWIEGLSASPPAPSRYRLKFSPDILAVGLGVSSLYGYAGQVYTAFSDLMGDHRFVVAGDVAGRLDEYVHLYGAYLNSRHRLGFGAAAFYGRHFTLIGALYHDVYAGGRIQLFYPFSLRARTEFDCYYSHVERTPQELGVRSVAFDVLLPSLSYVYDNVVWGMTGPVNGARARVSVTAVPPARTFEAAFASGEFDYRRYFHFGRTFVLALRASSGASFSFQDGKSARRYILGGTDFWFNYRVNEEGYRANLPSVFYSDIVVPFRGWYFYDLSGSRYAVLNTEFRFPFVKELWLVWPLPLRLRYVNGAVFADMGNAWDTEDEYGVLPLPRTLYGGYGFGMRANLGVFVLRYDRAWRTDWRTFVNRPVNYWALGADF